MNKKKMMMFEIMSGSSGGGGADVSGVTATAPDVDDGKIFVDNTGSQVVGTSTYKADYIALRTDIDNLNDTLEPVLLGDGSDTNVYSNVSNVTATASDVATGKVFVDNTGTEVTGTAVDSSNSLMAVLNKTSGAEITLPSGITSIAEKSFGSYSGGYVSMSKINMPNSITTIGEYAFYGCGNLTITSLPSSLTTIGGYAFQGCTSLALTSLPNGLTTFSNRNVFFSCTNLSITEIPANIQSIPMYTFGNCTGLTELTFLGTPSSIDATAFNNCTNLTTIRVPWSEGAVSGAPWGATNATIVYDYTPS